MAAAADDSSSASPPAPTLFLSYSSADREAARRLRDAITAHGIDVWYDEDELAGGDAWDEMIRDRIRRCDFFMPVISQSTQARREGYFRREWRQAAERTLDMADDVLFLLPVAIDPIPEATARVPASFKQLQWIRCPDGEPTVELTTLCDRILHHDTDALPVVPPIARAKRPPPLPGTRSRPNRGRRELPPYPPQPQRPPGEPAWQHVFNVLVWLVRCGYRAYRGSPWIIRWLLLIWVVAFLLRGCDDEPDPPAKSTASVAQSTDTNDSTTNVQALIPSLSQAANELQGNEKLGSIARFVTALSDAAQSGRPLAIVTFASTDADTPAGRATATISSLVYSRLSAAHDGQVALSPSPLSTAPTNTDILTRAARLESKFVLNGWTTDEVLHVTLHRTGETEPLWTAAYPLANADPSTVTTAIVTALESNPVFPLPPVATPTPAPALPPPASP